MNQLPLLCCLCCSRMQSVAESFKSLQRCRVPEILLGY